MKNLSGRLLLVGAGKMGSALLAGWLDKGLAAKQVTVQDPMPHLGAASLLGKHNIHTIRQAAPPEQFEAIVLAIKPQMIKSILPPLKPLTGCETTVISVAAGIPLAKISPHCHDGTPVVRVMPNTPAAIGKGMSVLCAGASVSVAQKQLCSDLMSAVGETAWVEDEALMDPVTAVSGSGPAYVFYMAECLAKAGVEAGLSPTLAEQLANATISGAGALLAHEDLAADELRRNVTSPGGTTAAALDVLMAEDGLEGLMRQAVKAASKRSKELAKK